MAFRGSLWAILFQLDKTEKDNMARNALPTTELVRSTESRYSKEWFNKKGFDHGSTHKLKLEERRLALGKAYTVADEFVRQIAAQEKEAILAVDKFNREMVEPKGLSEAESKQFKMQFEALKMKQQANLFQLQCLKHQMKLQTSQLDATCLIVDCLTMRVKVKSKAGKEGHYRITLANELIDLIPAIDDVARLLQRVLNPAAIPGADDDETAEPASQLDDEDVVNDDDVERIKSEQKGDDK